MFITHKHYILFCNIVMLWLFFIVVFFIVCLLFGLSFLTMCKAFVCLCSFINKFDFSFIECMFVRVLVFYMAQ